MEFLKTKNRHLNNFIFIIWAGGTALLSYSLIYALRKPYTAASFDDLDFFGIDYKVAVTSIQILGYLLAKLAGIKLISELKRENRFKFFVISVILAELSLVLFGLLPAPYNAFAMFFNGLTLGCMWGVIFSFIEGRKVTDLLASLLGVSIVFSSGLAKSVGLYVTNTLSVDVFWMPALIGAVALPILVLFAFVLRALPNPNIEDIEHKSERVAISGKERKAILIKYLPILSLLFIANFLLMILRDIKEDFLVDIIDMTNQSAWLFTKVDSIVTLIILGLFCLLIFVKSNFKAIIILLVLVTISTAAMSAMSFFREELQLSPTVWLFTQSLPLYISFLTFQTVFFDRMIACFKIRGNVGYFIAVIDFIGYVGTVTLLMTKEYLKVSTEWFTFYNQLAVFVGAISSVIFFFLIFLFIKEQKKTVSTPAKKHILIDGISFAQLSPALAGQK